MSAGLDRLGRIDHPVAQTPRGAMVLRHDHFTDPDSEWNCHDPWFQENATFRDVLKLDMEDCDRYEFLALVRTNLLLNHVDFGTRNECMVVGVTMHVY